jgi:hypothetical protein
MLQLLQYLIEVEALWLLSPVRAKGLITGGIAPNRHASQVADLLLESTANRGVDGAAFGLILIHTAAKMWK